MKEEKNDKLIEERGMGLKAKMRRVLFVFLTSIGLVASHTYNVKHGEIDKNVKMESNIDKGKKKETILKNL